MRRAHRCAGAPVFLRKPKKNVVNISKNTVWCNETLLSDLEPTKIEKSLDFVKKWGAPLTGLGCFTHIIIVQPHIIILQGIHVRTYWKESMPVCTQDDVNIHTECTQSLYQNPCLLCIRVVAWILNALWHRWWMHWNVNALWHGFWAHYAMDSRWMPPGSPACIEVWLECIQPWGLRFWYAFWMQGNVDSKCILGQRILLHNACLNLSVRKHSDSIWECTLNPFANDLMVQTAYSGHMLQEPETMLHCMFSCTISALMHPGFMSKCLLKQYQKALRLHSRMHSKTMSECMQNP